jgi:Mg2+/Co2+ transporter CorC
MHEREEIISQCSCSYNLFPVERLDEDEVSVLLAGKLLLQVLSRGGQHAGLGLLQIDAVMIGEAKEQEKDIRHIVCQVDLLP